MKKNILGLIIKIRKIKPIYLLVFFLSSLLFGSIVFNYQQYKEIKKIRGSEYTLGMLSESQEDLLRLTSRRVELEHSLFKLTYDYGIAKTVPEGVMKEEFLTITNDISKTENEIEKQIKVSNTFLRILGREKLYQ